MILAIGEKTGLTIDGQKAVTFKAQNSSRFSSTAFKKEHPDLYANFVQTTSTRNPFDSLKKETHVNY